MVSVKVRMYLESLLNRADIDLDEYFAEYPYPQEKTNYDCRSCEFCRADVQQWSSQMQERKKNPYATHQIVRFTQPLICTNEKRNALGNLSRMSSGCVEYVRAVGSDDWEVAA